MRASKWLRPVVFGLAGILMAPGSSAQVYATAVSKNPDNGRAIVFRYIQAFGPGFERSLQPDRVILGWKYKSINGMPAKEDQQRMYALEDALGPAVEKDGFATLVLVSTGENLREWIYYARSEDEFLKRLNRALTGMPAFPIEIHTAADPLWTTYETFKAGVKGSPHDDATATGQPTPPPQQHD